MLASRGQRKRWLEATQVLIGDRKFSEPSWPGLVDGLSPERASRPPQSYLAGIER